MDDFEPIWRKIVEQQGQPFFQKMGRRFTYTVVSGAVLPSTTNRQLPRSQFRQALDRAPLRGPGELQDLQGPSYLWAILTDPRISGGTAS